MAKGPWEGRVGDLLIPPFFVYKYKPVDSPMHGGAVRIDWEACDYEGIFWMIEVKQLPLSRVTFNIEDPKWMRPLQIGALNDCAEAKKSMPLLAVGRGKILSFWGWRYLWSLYQWRKREQPYQPANFRPELIPLNTCTGTMIYRTDADWKEYARFLYRMEAEKDHAIARTLNSLVPLSSDPERSAWITRQGDCTLTLGQTRESGPSSSKQGVSGSSSENFRTGGMKSRKTIRSVR